MNFARLSQKLSEQLPIAQKTTDLRPHFTGRVAAITGAGSGIGQALATELAKLGCHLALSDVNPANLEQTAASLADMPVTITTTVLDVTHKEAVYDWADIVIAEHGKINFIFNNAGVALASTVEGMRIEDVEWIMNINFWGVVYGTKAFLPLIKNSSKDSGEHGHIINISSLFGLTAQPSQSAYNASKFAVRGFTESLRQELDIQRCDVSATCVHPGGIRTNIVNNSRGNDSLSSLGMASGEKSIKNMNKYLRFDPTDAARIILTAVANDDKRCLIGNDAKMMDILQRAFPANYANIAYHSTKLMKKLKGGKKSAKSRS